MSYNQHTTELDVCQVLSDKSPTGRERPWRKFKLLSSYYTDVYMSVDEKKAERLSRCGDFLVFRKEVNGLKLHSANFCRVRLCPICSWRRALKTYGQVRKIVGALMQDYSFLFLTLTIPNCASSELAQSLDTLTHGFNRLMKYKAVTKAVRGFYRAIEVTHNLEEDTFHPHIHAILAVKPSYYTSRDYIKQADWLEFWRRATKRPDIKIVDIRKVKDNGKGIDGICAEVSKYTVKPSEVICFDDWDLTVETVRVLDKALDKRRFIGFGGCFAEAHKKLNLDDTENGDLIHVETTPQQADKELELIAYTWHSGYCQYVKGVRK